MKHSKGFTLIELLIVIGIIAILAAIIYTAVDPARRFAEARNAARWSEVNSILNAVLKFSVDHSGDLPGTLSTATADVNYMLGTGSGCDSGCTVVGTDATCLNLTDDLVTNYNYLASIPYDPSLNADDGPVKTLYYITKGATGRITVGACAPETVGGAAPVITVSR